MATSSIDFSPRQLQYIVALAETLGFHKAAERCHVSQPTLSAQVKQLEDVLGLQIFERDRRHVLVTAAGRVVVEHARRILVQIEDLTAAARLLGEPGTGTFRIGVIPTVAPYLLPEVVPAARARYPRMQLVFREEKTDALLAELRDGRLDAGLLALEADIGEWEHGVILSDPFVVALPKGHRLTARKRIAAAELEDEPVLLLEEGHCFRTQAISACRGESLRRPDELELRATSLSTLAQMVSSGTGITLLPQIAVSVENRRAQLETRPFAPPVPHRTIALIWRPQSPYAAMFMELCAVFRKALRPAP